jgi:hypothetical protein
MDGRPQTGFGALICINRQVIYEISGLLRFQIVQRWKRAPILRLRSVQPHEPSRRMTGGSIGGGLWRRFWPRCNSRRAPIKGKLANCSMLFSGGRSQRIASTPLEWLIGELRVCVEILGNEVRSVCEARDPPYAACAAVDRKRRIARKKNRPPTDATARNSGQTTAIPAPR